MAVQRQMKNADHAVQYCTELLQFLIFSDTGIYLIIFFKLPVK